ncbi:serine/arginine-rich splicing factor RSZ21-like isoform X3 [Typha angustifolia]|uniref:serine/arginine-rich splicing factor RSZ21-like isoform X3 n=1 Tax=Typha angustifolia TaxID=59011 RepID=UPI003C30D71B
MYFRLPHIRRSSKELVSVAADFDHSRRAPRSKGLPPLPREWLVFTSAIWIHELQQGNLKMNFGLLGFYESKAEYAECVYSSRVWVARKPPGFAFIDFDDRRDAQDAIRELDGKNGWRVELSHNSSNRGRDRDHQASSDMKCYECGEHGHFARECHLRIGPGGLGSGRRHSRSPGYRRSPSYGRRSYSPRVRSPRHRSVSPPRGRSYSKSPPYRREESPYTNGYSRRSRS